MQKSKVVVAVNLDQDNLKNVLQLKGKPLLEQSGVTFVHIFKTEVYTLDITPFIYPSKEQYPEIEKSVISILENLGRELLSPEAFKLAEFKCFFDISPKEKMIEYLNEVRPDVVVSATRGVHGVKGIFVSSFTDYLCRFSPCPVYVLRPVKS